MQSKMSLSSKKMHLWLLLLMLLRLKDLVAAGCPIYLTISLVGKTLEDSTLEVNWGPECYQPPDWIGIFSEDPSTASPHPEARIINITGRAGRAQTNVRIGKFRFPKGWNRNDANIDDINKLTPSYARGKCLPYYVASFSENELLTVECLKIQPNWMTKLELVRRLPLKDLFIPGTHASGAYLTSAVKRKSSLLRDYGVAQHFDVWSQLVFGIRYLDLSIGFKSAGQVDALAAENFYLVNENVYINPLRSVLKDIRRFVMQSHEVVILDFSSFPIGFYKHPERHTELVHLLHTEIGELIYQRNESISATQCQLLSVDDVLHQDQYIIVLYPIEELPYPESETVMLCATWKRFTAGFMNTSETLDYMRLLFSKKQNSPIGGNEGWIFLAIKSLEQSLNTDKLQTNKERAAGINTKITNWLRGPWSSTANIVAIDFFSNTDIIDVAVYANSQKAFNVAYPKLVNFEIPESLNSKTN